MTTKKFFIMIVSVLVLIFAAIGAGNYFINPFGLFNESLMDWDSYNFTQNPRTAKIHYIDKNHDKYNAYIVGSSGCGSLDPKQLSSYTGKSYYNSFYYGSDLLDSYETVDYLIRNYTVDEIMLGINYNTAINFDIGEDQLNLRMPAKLSGKSLLAFYKDYLFADPRYFVNKLRDKRKDTFFTQDFDVFLPETGSYDKRLRDTEGIGDLNAYVEKEDYRVFQDYPREVKPFAKMMEFKETMAAIKKLCDENHVKLTVVVIPIYKDDFPNYPAKDLDLFYRSLAEITPFWDFSKSSISADPRYFYDATHFRNSVGRMILDRIYDKGDDYIPEDFGHYVDRKGVEDFLASFRQYEVVRNEANYTKKLPVLMLHHIGEGDYAISEDKLKAYLTAIRGAGYHTVGLQDLYNYVYKGVDLGDNPILITFDDGYLSNYDKAFPLLKEMNMKAVIYCVGSTFGSSTYKDTGEPIIPHFGEKEAREMQDSGLIDIQSHSFDMHQSEELETKKPVRIDMGQFPHETEEEYMKAFGDDFKKEDLLIRAVTGQPIRAVAYPRGTYSDMTQGLLGLYGVRATFTSDTGVNTLIKGLPQSLYGLKRIEVGANLTPEELLQKIRGE